MYRPVLHRITWSVITIHPKIEIKIGVLRLQVNKILMFMCTFSFVSDTHPLPKGGHKELQKHILAEATGSYRQRK